jgi:hypothetical protein
MKSLYMVAATALAVLALFAVGAGAASAETFGVMCTSVPANHECVSRYAPGTEVTATSSGNVNVSSGGTTVNQCTGSTLKFRYNGESGFEYLSGTFSGCTYATKGVGPGELILKWKENSDSGLANWFGTFVEMALFGKAGTYRLSGAGIEVVGGTLPKLSLSKAPLVGVSGTTLSGLEVTANYNLSPAPIYVEKPAISGVLCTAAPVGNQCAGSQYSEGTEFTAKLKPGTSVLLKGPFNETLTQCNQSTIQFRYEGQSGFTYLNAHELKYVSSTWSECANPTTNVANGGLVVKFREGSTQSVGGIGPLVQAYVPVYGESVSYGPTGAGLNLIQGASPLLEFHSATMVAFSGKGSPTAVMSGTYELSPKPIYVGEA